MDAGLDGDKGVTISVPEIEAPSGESPGRRLSSFLFRHPRLRVGLLLTPPLSWLVLAYLGSLALLFVAAFWRLDPFTSQVVHDYGFQNFQQLWESDVYRRITLRTIGIAAAVTVTDVLLAFPIAFYMAKVASPRTRNLLVVAVLLPLWASYLVKVYAWRVILQENGILNWALEPFGLSGPGFGNVATWLVFSYLWLPFMILPVYAGLERIPNSLLEASSDLGGKGLRTLWRIVLPLSLPAIAAGSIFTFSLTLGDYITPQLVSSTQFIGNVVYINVGVANNLPFAAAFATVPVARDGRLPPPGPARGSVRQPMTVARRSLGAARPERRHARVHLLAADRDLPLRVQRPAVARLADSGPDDEVVREGDRQPGCPRRAPRLAEGGPRRDRDRTAARHARGDGGGAVPLLRARGDLVPRHPPDRAARDRDGMALNATFRNLPEPFGVELGLFTIMVGHATFCIVVVYNNVVARLRRTQGSLEEASSDLGADMWQTFRFVTFPQLKTALLAGGLLAFALSFDEVIVTTFTAGADQTLPIWILTNLSRPNQLPIVNVVAVFVILLSMIPVYFAAKLSSDTTGGVGR